MIIFFGILLLVIYFIIFRNKKRELQDNKWRDEAEHGFHIIEENNSEQIKRIAPKNKRKILLEPFEYLEKYTINVEMCMICKLEIRDKQKVITCPFCKSYFHEDHLIEWIALNEDCPVCKKTLKND